MPKQKVSRKKKEKSPPTLADAQPRLYENFRKVISQLVNGKNYRPSTLKDLMDKLQLPLQHAAIFEEALTSLHKEGLLRLNHGRYEIDKVVDSSITGVIRVHPRGFGFVKPDDPTPYTEDIFIPKHLTMNATDGDKVEVEVNPEISEKGPEGKVIAILSRSRTHIAGVILSVGQMGNIEAYAPLLGANKRILVEPNLKSPLKRGDRIIMKVLDWGSKESAIHCEFTNHIGHISDPSFDISAAIEEFGLQSSFSKKALQEAESHGKKVSREDISGREDLRDIETVTIDPDTAKDFDDAISLSKDKQGNYHLGVHIADVSHYVELGSALDIEARSRCNSTYFPGTCLPMLPPMLSENLCSLKPNVNRLTVSVFLDFDNKGNLLKYRIARTVIKSDKRFSYREAKAILDGEKKSMHAPLLHLMVELCGHLKNQRYQRGSIEFSLPDLVIKIDEKGMPLGVDYIAYDITHQMIEEFMLKANEIVALHLSKDGKGVAYRVHDEPSEDNMKDFSFLASAFGFNLKPKPTTKELQEFFYEALETPFGQYLATSYIRRMRQALYSPENIGHYGLGLTHYCHFTSPIRRYVDLVVHRTLFNDAKHNSVLELITQECSEKERISAKAEGNVILLKKLRLLAEMHKKNRYVQFNAVVTQVKQFGFSFDVLDYLLDSFFHVSELDDDYFVYEEAGVKLRGRHTGKVYTAGERITVMIKEIDLLRLESKWSLVPDEQTRNSKSKKLESRRKVKSTAPVEEIEITSHKKRKSSAFKEKSKSEPKKATAPKKAATVTETLKTKKKAAATIKSSSSSAAIDNTSRKKVAPVIETKSIKNIKTSPQTVKVSKPSTPKKQPAIKVSLTEITENNGRKAKKVVKKIEAKTSTTAAKTKTTAAVSKKIKASTVTTKSRKV